MAAMCCSSMPNRNRWFRALKAECISEVPLIERAGGLIGVAVTITNAGDVDVGVRAGRAIGARDAESGIQVAVRAEVRSRHR